jgi:hypothetical protein
MTSPENALIWFLRLSAVMLVAAAGAVVMPRTWMSAINDAIGLDPLPALPLVEYLTRSLSALYAALGACYWYVSLDLDRYLPLIRASVPVTLIFSVTLFAIDMLVELPAWWTWFEGPFLLAWTAALWWLTRRVVISHNRTSTPAASALA